MLLFRAFKTTTSCGNRFVTMPKQYYGTMPSDGTLISWTRPYVMFTNNNSTIIPAIRIVGNAKLNNKLFYKMNQYQSQQWRLLSSYRTSPSSLLARHQASMTLLLGRPWSVLATTTTINPKGFFSYSSMSSASGLATSQLANPISLPMMPSTTIGSISQFSSYPTSSGGNKGGSSQYNRPPSGMPTRPPNNNNNNNNNRNMGALGALGTGAVVLFGKTKYLLAALKLTKLASLGSMLLTIGTYSMFFGVPYAVGMVGLILVHEIGHALVMHQRGIPFSPMVFMPFMGAAIAMKQQPRDAWEDAMVAFGGPVLGSVGAGVVAVAGHSMDSQLLIALAEFGFMINLFNLLPLGSMDGGRIAGALSPYMNLLGVGMGAGLAYTGTIHNPVFYLILLAGGYETFQRFYNPNFVPPNYYKITPLQRTAIGLGYAGLIGSLALAMDVNERYKIPPEILVKQGYQETTWDMR